MRVGVGVRVACGPFGDVIGKLRVERAADATTCGESDEYRSHRHACALALVEQWKEVDGVLGDQGSPFVDRSGEHVRVGSASKADLADVDGIMIACAEKLADALAIHLVEQKPHCPANSDARATARSRTRSAASWFSRSLASISSRCSEA